MSQIVERLARTEDRLNELSREVTENSVTVDAMAILHRDMRQIRARVDKLWMIMAVSAAGGGVGGGAAGLILERLLQG